MTIQVGQPSSNKQFRAAYTRAPKGFSKIFRLTTRGRRHEPDDDLERLLAAVLDGDHDGCAAVAAAEVRVDVAVLQQVEDGAGHVEPARRVQRGQPELVQQVHDVRLGGHRHGR